MLTFLSDRTRKAFWLLQVNNFNNQQLKQCIYSQIMFIEIAVRPVFIKWFFKCDECKGKRRKQFATAFQPSQKEPEKNAGIESAVWTRTLLRDYPTTATDTTWPEFGTYRACVELKYLINNIPM